MSILKHHFEWNYKKISAYWFENRYRYTVSDMTNSTNGIEYREMYWLYPLEQTELERLLVEDIIDHDYGVQQLSPKCIRCSKHHGAPRKEYNLAPICNRCYSVMDKTHDIYGSGTVFYSINEDGSKGSVIKD
jgi:hypothetical protein